ADSALQMVRQRVATLLPQPVRHAMSLQGVITLEPQQRIEMRGAGRIALGHRNDVGAGGEPDRPIAGERLVEDLADQRRRYLGRAGQPRQVVTERALKPGLAENSGV